MQVLSSQQEQKQPLSSRDTPKSYTRPQSRYENNITSLELLDQLRLKLQSEQQEQKRSQISSESEIYKLKEQIQQEIVRKLEQQDQVKILTQKLQNYDSEMQQKEFTKGELEKEIKLLKAELEKERKEKLEFENKCKINDVLVAENKEMLDSLIVEQSASKKMAMNAEVNQLQQKQIDKLINENGSLTKKVQELQSQIKILQSNERDQKEREQELSLMKEKYSALQESQKLYEEKQQNTINSIKKDLEVEYNKKIQLLEQRYQRDRIEQNQIIVDLRKNNDQLMKINQQASDQKQIKQQNLPNVEFANYQQNLKSYYDDKKSYLTNQSQSLVLEKEKSVSTSKIPVERATKIQEIQKPSYTYKAQDLGSRLNLLMKK